MSTENNTQTRKLRRNVMKGLLSLPAAALILSVSAGSAKDKAGETFLKKAIEDNYAEVSMGDLAQKNGGSDGVKSFGRC
jgi:putative membrane protein